MILDFFQKDFIGIFLVEATKNNIFIDLLSGLDWLYLQIFSAFEWIVTDYEIPFIISLAYIIIKATKAFFKVDNEFFKMSRSSPLVILPFLYITLTIFFTKSPLLIVHLQNIDNLEIVQKFDNLPTIVTFPLSASSKYIFGVPTPEPGWILPPIPDPTSNLPPIAPPTYPRSTNGGPGFHIGMLFNADPATNYASELITSTDIANARKFIKKLKKGDGECSLVDRRLNTGCKETPKLTPSSASFLAAMIGRRSISNTQEKSGISPPSTLTGATTDSSGVNYAIAEFYGKNDTSGVVDQSFLDWAADIIVDAVASDATNDFGISSIGLSASKALVQRAGNVDDASGTQKDWLYFSRYYRSVESLNKLSDAERALECNKILDYYPNNPQDIGFLDKEIPKLDEVCATNTILYNKFQQQKADYLTKLTQLLIDSQTSTPKILTQTIEYDKSTSGTATNTINSLFREELILSPQNYSTSHYQKTPSKFWNKDVIKKSWKNLNLKTNKDIALNLIQRLAYIPSIDLNADFTSHETAPAINEYSTFTTNTLPLLNHELIRPMPVWEYIGQSPATNLTVTQQIEQKKQLLAYGKYLDQGSASIIQENAQSDQKRIDLKKHLENFSTNAIKRSIITNYIYLFFEKFKSIPLIDQAIYKATTKEEIQKTITKIAVENKKRSDAFQAFVTNFTSSTKFEDATIQTLLNPGPNGLVTETFFEELVSFNIANTTQALNPYPKAYDFAANFIITKLASTSAFNNKEEYHPTQLSSYNIMLLMEEYLAFKDSLNAFKNESTTEGSIELNIKYTNLMLRPIAILNFSTKASGMPEHNILRKYETMISPGLVAISLYLIGNDSMALNQPSRYSNDSVSEFEEQKNAFKKVIGLDNDPNDDTLKAIIKSMVPISLAGMTQSVKEMGEDVINKSPQFFADRYADLKNIDPSTWSTSVGDSISGMIDSVKSITWNDGFSVFGSVIQYTVVKPALFMLDTVNSIPLVETITASIVDFALGSIDFISTGYYGFVYQSFEESNPEETIVIVPTAVDESLVASYVSSAKDNSPELYSTGNNYWFTQLVGDRNPTTYLHQAEQTTPFLNHEKEGFSESLGIYRKQFSDFNPPEDANLKTFTHSDDLHFHYESSITEENRGTSQLKKIAKSMITGSKILFTEEAQRYRYQIRSKEAANDYDYLIKFDFAVAAVTSIPLVKGGVIAVKGLQQAAKLGLKAAATSTWRKAIKIKLLHNIRADTFGKMKASISKAGVVTFKTLKSSSARKAARKAVVDRGRLLIGAGTGTAFAAITAFKLRFKKLAKYAWMYAKLLLYLTVLLLILQVFILLLSVYFMVGIVSHLIRNIMVPFVKSIWNLTKALFLSITDILKTEKSLDQIFEELIEKRLLKTLFILTIAIVQLTALTIIFKTILGFGLKHIFAPIYISLLLDHGLENTYDLIMAVIVFMSIWITMTVFNLFNSIIPAISPEKLTESAKK